LIPRPIEACQYNETLIKVTRKDGGYTKNQSNYTRKVAIVELFSKTRICNLSVENMSSRMGTGMGKRRRDLKKKNLQLMQLSEAGMEAAKYHNLMTSR
jgi:hypothetical protein